jgi:hypothetical protein
MPSSEDDNEELGSEWGGLAGLKTKSPLDAIAKTAYLNWLKESGYTGNGVVPPGEGGDDDDLGDDTSGGDATAGEEPQGFNKRRFRGRGRRVARSARNVDRG